MQRMSKGADHAGCGAAGQLRIGVEREDVAGPAQHFDWTGLDGKSVKFEAIS